jgi:iron complex outermembrane recepter protein
MKRRSYQKSVAVPVLSALMCSVAAISAVHAQEADAAKTADTVKSAATSEASEQAKEQSQGTQTAVPKITNKAGDIEAQGGTSSFDAVKNVPGVTNADSKGPGADNIQLRGIHLASNTGYRINDGMPLTNNLQLPIEDKAEVQALKGVGALQFGIAAPGGIINYKTKRATDAPITDIGVSGNNFGQIITTIDVGRRLGANKELGVRINAAGGQLEPGIDDAGGQRWMGAVGIDWNVNSHLRTWLDAEQYEFKIREQGIINLPPAVNGVITLPDVEKINPQQLRSGLWSQTKGIGQFVTGGFEYKWDDGWKVFGEAGISKSSRPYRNLSSFNIAQAGVLNPLTPTDSTGKACAKTLPAKPVKGCLYWTQADTDAGNGTLNIVSAQHAVAENGYWKGEVSKFSRWGKVENEITFGYNLNLRSTNGNSNVSANVAQNLYNPYYTDFSPNLKQTNYAPQLSQDSGVYFQDSLTWDKWAHLYIGGRRVLYNSDLANNTPTSSSYQKTKSSEAQEWSPGLGFMLDLTRHLSVYGSYVKALEESPQAPANTVNFGSFLPPAVAIQHELGVKITNWNNFTATVGYFDIIRANAVTNPLTNVFELNGNQHYKGFEYVGSYRLGKDWTFTTQGGFTTATQDSTDPTINNKVVENTPRFNGGAGIAYRPPFVPGLQVSFGGDYKGERYVNPQNQAQIPESVIFSTGMSYKTLLFGNKTDMNFNVSNLFDTRDYSTANNTALGLVLERSYRFGMKVHF